MPFTEVQIANMALGRVGIQQTISSLSSASSESRQCNLFYEPARDAVLRDFPWPFARQYVSLALVSEFASTDDAVSHWAFAYRVPADCITCRRIVSPLGRNSSSPISFELGHDVGGLLIYCDLAEPVLEYTARFTDPAFFAADFAMALSWRLAVEIAMPLAVSAGLRQSAESEYRIAISRAQATALNEAQRDPDPESEFIRVRG